MDPCAAVTGAFLGWTLLAIFPRRVIRPCWMILRNLFILITLSFLIPTMCSPVLSIIVIFWIAYLLYQHIPAPQMHVAGKAVFITGCDQGLGHCLAMQLHQKGFLVFAGCLFPDGEGAESFMKMESDRMVVLPLDVTSELQVQEAARKVQEHLSHMETVLHGVVNNAGIMMIGNLELMTMSEIRKVMEVNYFGQINVYRAFMPLLRQPRSSTARLVNVASNIGLAPSKLASIYGASKAAVAITNETLRYELKPMGIDVVSIIPSGFKTGIQMIEREKTTEMRWQAASEEVKEYFGKDSFYNYNTRDDTDKFLNPDFTPITTCMEDALLSTHPQPIYYKGILARSWPTLYSQLPSQIWDLVMPYIADHHQFPIRALQRNNNNQQDGPGHTSDHSKNR